MSKYGALYREYTDSHLIVKSTKFAYWTIPSLMVQVSDNGDQQSIAGDFQSEGSLLVNALSSKLAGLLFPYNVPFVHIDLDVEDRNAIDDALSQELFGSEEPITADAYVARLVNESTSKLFSNSSFFQLVQCLKHLIVTGSACLVWDDTTRKVTVYGLNSFVTKRGVDGSILEAIIKETTSSAELSQEIINQIAAEKGRVSYIAEDSKPVSVDKYTRIRRTRKQMEDSIDVYEVTIEIDGVVLNDKFKSTYNKYSLPYVFPTWGLIAGEHYGRGLVEEHKGGLGKLSELAEQLTLYEIEMMKLVHLVGADSTNAIEELEQSETGQYIRATPNSVLAYESGSTSKVQMLVEDMNRVFTNLAMAFMYKGNTRDGERVTAYEISQQAKEVEATMGGAYSALAESMQLPLSYLLLFDTAPTVMTALIVERKMDNVKIFTGIASLTRASKADAIMQAIAKGAQSAEMLQAMQDVRVDPTKVFDAIYASEAIDTTNIFKSKEVIESEAESQVQQAQANAQMEQGQQGMQAALNQGI